VTVPLRRDVQIAVAMKNEAIAGTRPTALPKATRRFPAERTCAVDGCETKLSIYNRGDRCWAHAAMRIPRLRGRKPPPPS
jgi:hypothetical protein